MNSILKTLGILAIIILLIFLFVIALQAGMMFSLAKDILTMI